ncbi:MAG: phosphoglycerate mutase family protein [Actinomycetota bacterium]|nr:phosphoglycerate mutase family protein [Actinomycetota bacterium]
MLLLVRHSAPELDPARPADEWRLSDEGRERCRPLADRLAVFEPRMLLSSPEPKARETAELIAEPLSLAVHVDERLRETARSSVGWLEREELERGVAELFARPQELVFGEETADHALARFSSVVDGLQRAAVVSHGRVISLYAARRTGRDPFELWRSLKLPDVVVL